MINANYKGPIIFAVLIVVILVAYGLLTMKDNRDVSDKVSDAYHELEDRTPGQKLGDAVKDAGDKIKENTEPTTAP